MITVRQRLRFERTVEIMNTIIERYKEKPMILKGREMTFVTHVPKTQYYISDGYDKHLLKDGTISTNASNGWWHSRVEAEIFLAGWQLLQQIDTSKVDKVQQFPLGMRYKDTYGRTWRYHHKVKPPYQFQAGDVVEFEDVGKRIIVDASSAYPTFLVAVDVKGWRCSTANELNPNFVGCHYKKIGELRDFIGD